MKLFIALMALSVFIFVQASTFPDANNYRSGNFVPGPAFFPQLLSTVLFLASGIELILDFRKRKQPPAEPDPNASENEEEDTTHLSLRSWGTQNIIMIIVLLGLFPFLLEEVGFAIMGFAITFLVTWRLKAGLVKSLIFSAAIVFVIMFFFKHAFFLQLPEGIWSPV